MKSVSQLNENERDSLLSWMIASIGLNENGVTAQDVKDELLSLRTRLEAREPPWDIQY